MDAFAKVVSQVVDVLVLPFGRTHHTLQLVWLSLLTGLGMAYVFKLTSSQRAIKRTKDRIKARILEMRLYQDDAVLILRGLGGALRGNIVYLGTIFVPFVIIVVPVAIVFTQLDQRYSRSHLAPGSNPLLTVKLKEGFNPFETAVELTTGGEVSIHGKPVRDSVSRKVIWKLHVGVGGTHEVAVYAKGTSYTFPLVAEGAHRMIGFQRKASGLFEPILHPALPPIPPDSPFELVEVGYPSARHPLLGRHVHWIVIFLVYSLIAAAALKILIGIEI
ncbi:MAG: hypothetical protein HXY50_16960 [Ignavibacteriaceae bacterium]|nr:hypothetical protein [Ignavibacteriaceae bacterium]